MTMPYAVSMFIALVDGQEPYTFIACDAEHVKHHAIAWLTTVIQDVADRHYHPRGTTLAEQITDLGNTLFAHDLHRIVTYHIINRIDVNA